MRGGLRTGCLTAPRCLGKPPGKTPGDPRDQDQPPHHEEHEDRAEKGDFVNFVFFVVAKTKTKSRTKVKT